MAIEIKRTYKGELTLHVNGQPASAAKFGGVTADGASAVFVVPFKDVTLGETDNVVPFVKLSPS